MSRSNSPRLPELFGAALALPAAERASFLDDACGGDAVLRADLDEMLALDARLAGATLRSPTVGMSRLVDLDDGLGPGRRVGAYELCEALGRGGMGSVYRARRVDGQVEQQVAIKFVRRDLMAPEVLRRFAAERQILATLDHPHIARLIDAGERDNGDPYGVLEFVDGLPIDRYAATAGLDLRARVRLVRDVAEAVAYAHRSLIAHRDLKPGNILVTAAGVPKLIDFGIAKPIAAAAAEATATATAERYFSLAYAAPEQLTGAATGVGCDIYALGLLLHELITGCRPFDLEGLTAGQVERLICEVPSAAPSARLARQGGSRAAVAALRGDLDQIVLTCLRKAPAERYASAEQFCADLDHYLAGRPVVARGGHAWYRLRKFVGRHRVATAAAGVALATLVGAGALLTVQRNAALAAQHLAEQQRDYASAVSGLLVSAFRDADPGRALGAEVPARQILEQGAARVRHTPGLDPGQRTRLLATLGDVYLALGAPDRALDLLDQARDGAALDAESTALAADARARAALAKGDADRAERELDVVPTTGVSETTRLALVASRAQLLRDRGRYDEAATLLQTTLDGSPMALPPATRQQLLQQLAEVHLRRADFAAGIAINQSLYEAQQHQYAGDHPDLVRTLSTLTSLKLNQGDNAAALQLAQQNLAMCDRLYGRHSVFSAGALSLAANALAKSQRAAEAVAYNEEAVAIWRALAGERHPSIARTERNLALLYANYLDQPDKAELAFAEALRLAAQVWPSSHPNQLIFAVDFAHFLNKTGRHAEVLARLGDRVAELEAHESMQQANATSMQARLEVGVAEAHAGSASHARQLLSMATPMMEKTWGTQDPRLAEAHAIGSDGRPMRTTAATTEAPARH